MKSKKQRKMLLEQLRKTPVVQIACQKLDIHRATFYRWCADDPTFAEQADQAISEGSMLINDMAESQLISAIQEKNLSAIQFWLKHHHQKYGTKIELSGKIAADKPLTPEQELIIREAMRLASPEQAYDQQPDRRQSDTR